jgi:hypothetical protein
MANEFIIAIDMANEYIITIHMANENKPYALL